MPRITADLGPLQSSIGVSACIGDTRTVDGRELLPVCLVWGGFGAGRDAEAEGSGAGGLAIPLGAYSRRGEHVCFRPNPVTALVVGTLALSVLAHSVEGLARALTH